MRLQDLVHVEKAAARLDGPAHPRDRGRLDGPGVVAECVPHVRQHGGDFLVAKQTVEGWHRRRGRGHQLDHGDEHGHERAGKGLSRAARDQRGHPRRDAFGRDARSQRPAHRLLRSRILVPGPLAGCLRWRWRVYDGELRLSTGLQQRQQALLDDSFGTGKCTSVL